jgi:2-keto-3-deoxy-L-rhamnonate aldolase RhmA
MRKMLELRDYLKKTKMAAGFLITISDPSVIETFSFINPDFFIVDMEHSDISIGTLTEMVVRSDNIPVIARIKGNDKNEIKKILDTGVDGIIIPGIESYEDAMLAVKYSIFPPDGIRGIGPGRVSGYGRNMREYLKKKPIVIIQIETKGAYRDLHKITQLENLDGIFVGPVDLSNSLGMPFTWGDEVFLETIEKILRDAKDSGLITGIYSPFDKNALFEIDKLNVNFLMYGMDREAMLIGYEGYFDLLKSIKVKQWVN